MTEDIYKTITGDWSDWRRQWEYSHAIRFALHLAAFSVLALSILRKTPTEAKPR